MSKNVKLEINASIGKVKLQCSEEYFEDAMGQCIELITKYQGKENTPHKYNSNELNSAKAEVKEDNPIKEEVKVEPPKRTRSKSGKTPNYSVVDLGLSDDQKRQLREFFLQKSPSRQNDLVCVVAAKLKEIKGKDNFSCDEIFSALRYLPEVATPKNLRAVFQNIMNEGNGEFADGCFVANFATDDHVRLNLPKTDK